MGRHLSLFTLFWGLLTQTLWSSPQVIGEEPLFAFNELHEQAHDQDAIRLSNGCTLRGRLLHIPSLQHSLGEFCFSVGELAGIGFYPGNSSAHYVTRSGEQYIGCCCTDSITLWECQTHCEVRACGKKRMVTREVQREIPLTEIETISFKERGCSGRIFQKDTLSLFLETGERFAVRWHTHHIPVTDGKQCWNIETYYIHHLRYDGRLWGWVNGEGVGSRLPPVAVLHDTVSLRLVRDGRCIDFPWNMIASLRADNGCRVRKKCHCLPNRPPFHMVYIPPGEAIVELCEERQSQIPLQTIQLVTQSCHSFDQNANSRKLALAAPSQTIEMEGFYIDRYEVTNAAYQQFVDATSHRAPPHWRNGQAPYGSENHPVVNVSCRDAESYASWVGKRLPSALEWERAARGVTDARYPYGDEYHPALANVASGQTLPVGSYQKITNATCPERMLKVKELCDLCGNVAEWTASPYPEPCPKHLCGEGTVRFRAVRGGSFKSSAATATTYHTKKMHIDDFNESTGFRCAMDVMNR